MVANLTSCHRDPKYWKQPDKFVPEHFLDPETGAFIEDKPGFAPYGYGIRRCPGEDLANIEFFLIMANLLKVRYYCRGNGKMGAKGAFGTVKI